MKKWIVFGFLFVIMVLANELVAQCPMCKMAAESNLKNGGSAGKGLNAGILYMLLTPYLLVGGLAYWWIKNKKKVSE
jgi:hypothetical protein